MTDRIISERAVVAPVDCDRFDELLPDFLEGGLPADVRAAAESHRVVCDRCRALVDDLVAITRDAAALGPREPARDLWAGIAARIEAPVVPLGRTGEHAAPALAPTLRVERGSLRTPSRKTSPFFASPRWLAAAAGVLVAVSVGSTYGVMRLAGRARSTTVAATSPTPRASASQPALQPTLQLTPAAPSATTSTQLAAATPVDSAASRADEHRSAAPRRMPGRKSPSDAQLVARVGDAYVPAVRTYDREITDLRAALRRRSDLDSSTVSVLEKSLRVIDDAIAQSRRALERDPHSRLLSDQLTRTLDQKVELLRTAVLLPSRSN